MLFDGEYLNDKIWNGYVNEIIDEYDWFRFEGEYLNGKKWNGKGIDRKRITIIYELNDGKELVKEYKFGMLKFEGEYLNGERNGKGKVYDEFGKIIFEGKYLKGKRLNGKIKQYFDAKEKLKYEYDNINGLIWNGKEYDINGVPICEINDGNGNIREFDYDKLKFEGEYLNGERNGKGKEYDEYCNLIFEGEYLKGKKWNGKGYDNNGNIIYELNNGNGIFKKYNDYGKLSFEGEYLNGEKNGKGKEYDEFGKVIFEGEYLNGKRNGKGKKYDEFGKVIFEGEYLNGKRWNGIKKIYNNYDKLILQEKYLNGKK